MRIFRTAALSAGWVAMLVGCAAVPLTQPVKEEVLSAMQPVSLRIGIAQTGLSASFVHSNAGAAGSVGCAVIPGVGVLLAAVCGGAFGAIDAGINEARAREADELVRPLKDELVDLDFDPLMRDALTLSLESVPGMQLADIDVTKSVNEGAYEELFAASTSSAVMFATVEYRLTADFSALELSVRGLIFPRSPAARSASGLPIASKPVSSNESPLMPKNAAYRASITYRAELPAPGRGIAENIAHWRADDGRLLRAALHDGIAQAGRLLAEDLQRGPGTASPPNADSVAAANTGNSVRGDVLWQAGGGSLLRAPDGALHFHANLEAAANAFDADREAASLKPPASRSGIPS